MNEFTPGIPNLLPVPSFVFKIFKGSILGTQALINSSPEFTGFQDRGR